MRKTIYILIMCIVCGMNVFAQKSHSVDALGRSVMDYYGKLPQEKIYVHTDRTTYIAGDTIWLRAYVVDAATNKLASAPLPPFPTTCETLPPFPTTWSSVSHSKFVYVELIDNTADTVVTRMKIKEMPAAAFDSLSKDQTKIFANALVLPKKLYGGEYTLTAYTQWMRNFGEDGFYRKKIIVAGKEPKSQSQGQSQGLALRLFPEGGNLIADCHQRLAYKAIGEDGLGVDIKVKLVDESGKVLQKGESQHLGMGSLLVYVGASEKLFLEAETADGRTARVPLPKALPHGVGLKVNQHDGQLLIQPIASDGFDISSLSILIYGAGNLLQADNLSLSSPFKVAMKDLTSGVINIALINPKTKHVWAERLAFVR